MVQLTKEETGYFSSFDGTRLFYRAWEKDTDHALIIVHGIGEHSGRYQELAEALGELPLSIFVFDLRGHGRSEGEKVYVNSFKDYLKDLCQYRTFILDKRAASRKREFILLGQSLGALIATHAVLENQSNWQRLILLSPFFGLPLGECILRWVSGVARVLAPKRIWKNPIKPDFLTHDLECVRIYKQDALIQRQITGRLAHEMLNAALEARRRAREISVPLFVLAGGTDSIVSVSRTREFVREASSKEKELQVFQECYHELLHEIDRKQYIQILKEYLSHS